MSFHFLKISSAAPIFDKCYKSICIVIFKNSQGFHSESLTIFYVLCYIVLSLQCTLSLILLVCVFEITQSVKLLGYQEQMTSELLEFYCYIFSITLICRGHVWDIEVLPRHALFNVCACACMFRLHSIKRHTLIQNAALIPSLRAMKNLSPKKILVLRKYSL